MKTKLITIVGSLVLMTGMMSGPAAAGPLPVFGGSYPSPNAACATFGNFVSCSTAVLEQLAGQPGFSAPGTFSFAASQGHLIDAVVIGANNGNILNNGDTVSPSEDAFSTVTPRKDYFFTGDDGNDPTNNGLLAGDTPYSWDIGLGDLAAKLTFDNAFHQMLIALDLNQPQNSTASLPIWSLFTVRDTDGNQQNVYFETQPLDLSNIPTSIFKDPTGFSSTKTFDGSSVTTPGAGDFLMTNGEICVVNTMVSYPAVGGACPSGGTLVNTNRASNEVEFINYIPGLDIQGLLGQGYDTLSVQVWMGCFNTGNPRDNSGPALLNGGTMGPCDTGGFGDIFLIAGGAMDEQVPEPSSLLLFAIALLGLASSLRRYARQTVNQPARQTAD